MKGVGMDLPRIGFAITRYPPVIGGAELHTHELVRRLSEVFKVRVATLVDYRTSDWLGEVMTAGVKNGKRYRIDGVEVTIPRLDNCEMTIVQGLLQTYKTRPEIRQVLGKALVSIYRAKLEYVFSDCRLVHCVHV